MSNLQISLLAIGAVVVLAVYLYNVLQERRARKGMESNFERPPDVLLSDPAPGNDRVEPVLRIDSQDPGASPDRAVPPSAGSAPAAPLAGPVEFVPEPRSEVVHLDREPDADTECVMLLRSSGPVRASALRDELHGKFGKAMRWFGRRFGGTERWLLLDAESTEELGEIAACLMLVDRDGPVSTPQLQTFLRMVADLAESLSAEVHLPRVETIVERAKALDAICAEVDVQIGISLLRQEGAASGATIPGTRLRGVVEAAGFRLNKRGQFEYLQEDTGSVLFSLQNMRADQPFTVESLRTLQTPGVTLILDVPRTAEPVRAFDQMRQLAKRLSTTLEASVVDDNRKPISDAALGTIRNQVLKTVTAMRTSNIEPGSPRALRLFV